MTAGLEWKQVSRILPPWVVAAVWVVAWGVVDWLTGPELGVSAFYLPGIILAAWYSGRLETVCVVLLAALAWLLADLNSNSTYEFAYTPYWNAFIRLLIFLVTAVLTSEVRERRKMERAYREQKEILASILDSMEDGVLVVSDGGRIISFNPAAERMFGSDAFGSQAEEWLSLLELTKLDPPDRAVPTANALRQAIEGRLDGYGECILEDDQAGVRRHLGLTVQPLLGEGSRRSGVVIVVHDLTARRELDQRIAEAGELEKRRIGQDLHDGVCQHLVGVGFALGSLQSDLESLDLEEQSEKASEIGELVRQAIGQAKGLARGLFPVGLDEDLDYALQTLVKSLEERFGTRCHYERAGFEIRLDPTQAGHLYRIGQEALINAVNHAAARQVRVFLKNDDTELRLVVSDDGKGIVRKEDTKPGVGLQIMRHRANLIGASLEIDTGPDRGTSVICRLPYRSGKP